ncbi:MAG: phosphate propanoyltransferase [Clostridia bacterium]|nr:phosphate propanoyltransferase [Clostridia bacterium]
MNEDEIRGIVDEVIRRTAEQPKGKEILLEMSARHVHVTQEALEVLFGKGSVLDVKKELSQPGQFQSSKKVKLITKKGEIAGVSILGPVRREIQVELSMTDCRTLGIDAPVNLSGDLTGAGDCLILGDCGCVEAKGSVIVAKAHVHMNPEQQERYGVMDGDHVKVRIESRRPVTLDDVIVRVKNAFLPAVHIDTDEANACGGTNGARAYLMGRTDTVFKKTAPGPGPASPIRTLPRAAEPAPKATCLTFSGKLFNEEAARETVRRNTSGTVTLREGTLVTAAAKDILNAARIRIQFI